MLVARFISKSCVSRAATSDAYRSAPYLRMNPRIFRRAFRRRIGTRMTAYHVMVAEDVAIMAVTYEIRITQVLFFAVAGGGEVVYTVRHEGSTLSGGTTIDIVPLHQGAPAASATAMAGTSLSYSGIAKIVGSTYVPPATTASIVGTTVITNFPGSTAQIQSPLTLTVAPGSVFATTGVTSSTVVQIYFEELRLAGSY
jgi:hypothetical protein